MLLFDDNLQEQVIDKNQYQECSWCDFSQLVASTPHFSKKKKSVTGSHLREI